MKIPPYIALKLEKMTIQKLLGLLFEHIESGDILGFCTNGNNIKIDITMYKSILINLNQDILQQYNKIFNYE